MNQDNYHLHVIASGDIVQGIDRLFQTLTGFTVYWHLLDRLRFVREVVSWRLVSMRGAIRDGKRSKLLNPRNSMGPKRKDELRSEGSTGDPVMATGLDVVAAHCVVQMDPRTWVLEETQSPLSAS